MKTVRDLMHTDVVTVSKDTTLHDLARVFSENEISGAPVVDNDGTVVGVVSTTDIVRFAADEVAVNIRSDRSALLPTEDWVGTGEVDDMPTTVHHFLGSDMDDYTVQTIMTTANFHVSPDTSLSDLARFLLRGRIHRALVMDEGKLEGIVTSHDLLRAIAEA